MTDFVGHKLGLGNGHEVGDGQEVHSPFPSSNLSGKYSQRNIQRLHCR